MALAFDRSPITDLVVSRLLLKYSPNHCMPQASRHRNLSGTALYNQYRTGVGALNLTEVNVMSVIEIGLKYRF